MILSQTHSPNFVKHAQKQYISLFWVCRYYLCYFPQYSLNTLGTNVYTILRPFKKSCLNFAQRQICLVTITSPLSPLPLQKKKRLNRTLFVYFILHKKVL